MRIFRFIIYILKKLTNPRASAERYYKGGRYFGNKEK